MKATLSTGTWLYIFGTIKCYNCGAEDRTNYRAKGIGDTIATCVECGGRMYPTGPAVVSSVHPIERVTLASAAELDRVTHRRLFN